MRKLDTEDVKAKDVDTRYYPKVRLPWLDRQYENDHPSWVALKRDYVVIEDDSDSD